jgi:hypothetical protein
MLFFGVFSYSEFLKLRNSKPKNSKNATILEILNLTRPTYHYFIYRNDWADLMYSSMKPAHDP